jgi:hypothetical protein
MKKKGKYTKTLYKLATQYRQTRDRKIKQTLIIVNKQK